MQPTRKKTLLILLVAVLAAFWQVAFFRNTLKWDALDISFSVAIHHHGYSLAR